jgi:ferredoxin--NADP+ reductase
MRELTKLEGADLVIAERDLKLDPLTQAALEAGDIETQNERNYKIMREDALRAPRPGRKVVQMRFYESPVEILGEDSVTGVRVRRNTLKHGRGDRLSVEPLDDYDTIPCGAVFRSIGYKVAPMEGVPYDAEWSVIPHDEGQVLAARNGDPVPGLFVAGWAKRGPSGVIGTNKPDAAETVHTLLKAFQAGRLPTPTEGDVGELLDERGVQTVSYDDWKTLDGLEIAAGEAEGRPRTKFANVAAMLAALSKE